jgi:hypothetical protein
MGRFLTKDTWAGNANLPLSFNKWSYVEGNPINYSDPTGNFDISCNASSPTGWCFKEIEIFPGFVILWPVPCETQTQQQPVATTTPAPQYHTVIVKRGMKSTSPSEFRFDPPSEKDWLGGLSVYEILYASYKYELPFVVTYRGDKDPYKTTGTVIGALTDGQTFIGGGTALYTPDDGNPTIGAEHWSVTFGGVPVEDLKRQMADFAKKYFNIKSQ